MARLRETSIWHYCAWRALLLSKRSQAIPFPNKSQEHKPSFFSVILPLTLSAIKWLTEIQAWGTERTLFVFGLICPNGNSSSPIYPRHTVCSPVLLCGRQRPLRWNHLPPSQQKTTTERTALLHKCKLPSLHCKKRILEVSVVNKNEAWIKKYAESTGNLNRRIKKIKKISLRIRHKELILQLQ